jgi:hypothetical protein
VTGLSAAPTVPTGSTIEAIPIRGHRLLVDGKFDRCLELRGDEAAALKALSPLEMRRNRARGVPRRTAQHWKEVTLMNQLIRHQLTANGALGRKGMTVVTPHGPVEYRKGDQVLVTRNHHDRQLLNGSRGTVRTLRRDGIVLDLTGGRRITLSKTWLAGGDLDHGYATTLHKAQGRTVHTSLVLADESLGQEGAYVGLSRGTSSNHLYLDTGTGTGTEHALRDCGHFRGTARPAPPQRPDRALTRSTRQSLANDYLQAGPGLTEGRGR